MRQRDTAMNEQLSELWTQHRRLVFGLAWQIMRNTAAAEDMCQQAFLKAWDQRHTIDDPRALRAWICRVVVRESLQWVRRRNTEQRVLATFEPDDAAPPDDGAGERRAAVLAAIEKLPSPVRDVVVLRLVDGRAGNDVAELLGCSKTEVSRRLHRGMEMLRASLVDWRDSVRS